MVGNGFGWVRMCRDLGGNCPCKDACWKSLISWQTQGKFSTLDLIQILDKSFHQFVHSTSGPQPQTNRTITLFETFANTMAFTYFTWKVISRDRLTSKWTSSQDNFFACVCAASYRIKLLTNQCTVLSKTPSTEPETHFESLVLKWNHPFHESDVVVVNMTLQSRIPYAPSRGYCSTELPF